MWQRLVALCKDEEGPTAIEYALLAAAIAGVIVGVVLALGKKVNNLFEDANSRFPAP